MDEGIEEQAFTHAMLGRYKAFLEAAKQIDINCQNDFGQTLLHVALAYRNPDIAKATIDLGVNVNFQDRDGGTALHYAPIQYEVAISKMLLEKGGNVNLIDKHGNNALWTATLSSKGKHEIVQAYFEANGDPFHKNKYGKSAYDFAVTIGDQFLIELFGSQVTGGNRSV